MAPSTPIAIGILRALVIAARQAGLAVYEARRFAHPRHLAIAAAINDAGHGFPDERAERDARAKRRKFADSFHCAVHIGSSRISTARWERQSGRRLLAARR